MNKYHEEFHVENDVLHVHLSGEFPDTLLNSEENLFQPLINACAANNCSKAIVDARDLRVNFDTLALFRAGEDAASASRVSLRIALLAREEQVDTFFSNVVSNRGGQVGVFTDIESARSWFDK